ncbi:hypothetical protein GCM10009836_52160 [Pseudonocardia ailaonensis]|uniref:Uncharacterized protein n=1 Tax=Pseudonocardia ailaonensis TaxID=367279 RepID=A0ABN2NF05_9PSEU
MKMQNFRIEATFGGEPVVIVGWVERSEELSGLWPVVVKLSKPGEPFVVARDALSGIGVPND